jgi:hypothetical protein
MMSTPIKHVELTHAEWNKLKQELVSEHGKSIMISWVMKQKLGFTIREHLRFNDTYPAWEDRRSVICLDFYDEAMRTWYILKYE